MSRKIVKLEEIVNIENSKRKPIGKGNRIKGNYPYYGANGITDWVEDFIFDGEYLLIGEDGSVITKDNKPILNMVNGKFWVNNHAHILSEKSDMALLRYVYYALSCLDISSEIVGTAPPKLTLSRLKSLEIPLPPLAEQQAVVDKLDLLTEYTEEYLANLQRELELREQQYKYHMDKLINDSSVYLSGEIA